MVAIVRGDEIMESLHFKKKIIRGYDQNQPTNWQSIGHQFHSHCTR